MLLFLILNCCAHSQAEIHLLRLPGRREPRVTLGPYLEALVGTWKHTSGVEALRCLGALGIPAWRVWGVRRCLSLAELMTLSPRPQTLCLILFTYDLDPLWGHMPRCLRRIQVPGTHEPPRIMQWRPQGSPGHCVVSSFPSWALIELQHGGLLEAKSWLSGGFSDMC